MFPISQALNSQVKAFPVGVVLMFYILVAHIQNKIRSSHLYTFFFFRADVEARKNETKGRK